VLVAFLTTGVVAAPLLNRAQERAEIARQRAIEVERLAALGSETLNAGRAEDALLAIAEVIRSTIGVDCCEVLVPRGTPSQLTLLTRAGPCSDGVGAAADVTSPWSLAVWVAEKRAVAAERADGTKWIGAGDHSDELLRWPAEAPRSARCSLRSSCATARSACACLNGSRSPWTRAASSS
jgi:hypothetical protein